MNENTTPLAERLRPKHLEEVIGQEHLTGNNGPLATMLATQYLQSCLLWGPPGTGKTTLAEILAKNSGRNIHLLSAIEHGVKDLREVIEKAKHRGLFSSNTPILFIDEIHRFSKSQQDSLLSAVEKGIIILIGATTENPSFEINAALLSRMRVFRLNALDNKALKKILDIGTTEIGKSLKWNDTDFLIETSQGDARKLLGNLESLAIQAQAKGMRNLDAEFYKSVLQDATVYYDKNGEQHYNLVSAFIKSVRGSDPDAALYWLARMLVGGEDPKFIARRMVILASEDVGLANVQALSMATSCLKAVQEIGMPEARIILSQTAVYLAVSPKSNSTYSAINHAMKIAQQTAHLPVPMHLCNAPNRFMKEYGFGEGYDYSHKHPGHFSPQVYLPNDLADSIFYHPADNPVEQKIQQRQDSLWNKKTQP